MTVKGGGEMTEDFEVYSEEVESSSVNSGCMCGGGGRGCSGSGSGGCMCGGGGSGCGGGGT